MREKTADRVAIDGSPSRRALFALIVLGCLPRVAAAAPELQFTDITAASGVAFTMTSGRTPSTMILEVDGGGVALFDYDRDGDLDLFLANGATVEDTENGPGSRLYANRGNGSFIDVTQRVGIRLKRWAMGVAVGDYDHDGDEDLYVTCFGRNVLLQNDCASSESCRFTDVSAAAGVDDPRWGTSAAFGDFDGDGDLDLYAVNYLEFDPGKPPRGEGPMFLGVPVMAGPAGLEAQADILYENRGDGTFRDITAASGAAVPRPGYGLGTVVVDADRDGKLDIFVGNDSTQNFLLHNQGGGKFKNIGIVSGIASNFDGSSQATMGIAVADVDANGYPDIFTTNFSSDTNTLHLNLSGRWFDDRTSQFGLAMISRPFLSWGTGFYDFDLDGDEDLFIASGHVYPQADTHKMDSSYEQFPLLFQRVGKRFAVRENAGAPFRERFAGRATAFGDIDGDGDVDIVMTTLNGPVRVFRNDTPHAPALAVFLETTAGSAHVPGAVVEFAAGGHTQRRWLDGGSYQSSDSPAAYFGVRDRKLQKATLRVVWPGGQVNEFPGIPMDRRVTLVRGKQAPRIEKFRR